MNKEWSTFWLSKSTGKHVDLQGTQSAQ